MQVDIQKLIIAIVSYVNTKGGYTTKTKLVKFLYLIDLEYYRKNNELLTGLDWIFYKYGPYSSQFETIYSNLAKDELKITRKTAKDYEADILSTTENFELTEIIRDPGLSLLIKKVISRWTKEPLHKLLDYVYFETEPMLHAKKNHRLDFSLILPEEDIKLSLKKSNIKPAQLKKLKEKLNQIIKPDNSISATSIFPKQNIEESTPKRLFTITFDTLISH